MTTTRYTPDELDAAYAAVARRHPDLQGDALDRKVRRVAAIMRHSQDAQTWTHGRERQGRGNEERGGKQRCPAGVPGCDTDALDTEQRTADDGVEVTCRVCPVCAWMQKDR